MTAPFDSSCHLCDILAKGVGHPFRHLFPDSSTDHEVFYRTANLALMLDIAPVVEGYLLAFSTSHQPSFAAAGSSHLVPALGRLLLRCEAIFQRVYGLPAIAFEHGPSPGAVSRGCCIDHAHLHIVPSRVDILDARRNGFESFDGLEDALSGNGDADYLYYRDVAGRHWRRSTSGAEAQFFRRLLASATNSALWNWTDYVLLAEAAGTRTRIDRAREAIVPLLKEGA